MTILCKGFTGPDPMLRQYVPRPSDQLNRWTDGYDHPYYGQECLLNRYVQATSWFVCCANLPTPHE